MSDGREISLPASYGLSLVGAVGAAAAVAALWGGGEWALGATLGAGAAAADFYFLALFAVAWFEAARRGGRGVLARGLLALLFKAALPPAIIIAILWARVVPALPAALGAVVVATAAPAFLVVYFLGKGSGRRPVG